MARIPQTKIFNGQKYGYHTTIVGKIQAESVANTMRGRGWKVRIVPAGGRDYRLYAKSKTRY